MKSVQKITKELAEQTGIHFNKALVIVASERILLRLSKSAQLNKSLIFKGGIILNLVYKSTRFTRDIDASFKSIGLDQIKSETEEKISLNLEDSLFFKITSWKEINEMAFYSGLRARVDVYMNQKKSINLHIDFTAQEKAFETMGHSLEEGSSIQVYLKEQIYAEKLQAFVFRSEINARVKDIYDIIHLTEQGLNYDRLSSFIDIIFDLRDTAVPRSLYAFSKGLNLTSLQKAWGGLRKESKKYSSFEKLWGDFLKSMLILDQEIL